MNNPFRRFTLVTAGRLRHFAIYYNASPWRTYYVGLSFTSWRRFGRTSSVFVKAFAIGPLIVGRTDIPADQKPRPQV